MMAPNWSSLPPDDRERILRCRDLLTVLGEPNAATWLPDQVVREVVRRWLSGAEVVNDLFEDES